LIAWLEDALRRLHEQGAPGFGEVTQAREVLQSAREVLKGYREYHADLLAHLDDAELFQPFFLVRVFEAILVERALEGDDPLVTRVIRRLNDFVGHRPVALFETRPEGEPYPHEKHRPVPVWIAGAGAACGPWREVLEKTLELLRDTSPAILADAQFDRDALEEIALDMRAYDHLHPANRRTNYVFGEWDPHHLDGKGRFCRYVIRKVVLEALMERVKQLSLHSRGEAVWEGAAVLAGTVLMASGVSGSTPSAHDSSTSLASLIPRIARYRDAFYQELLTRMEGAHAERIRQEIATTGQPFGAARQHLNATLARLRAEQMQYAFLARVYAEMGYPDASKEAAERIPAVAARMLSSIHSSLTSAGIDLEHGRAVSVVEHLRNIEELIHRAIDCGAVADPWNILGFDGLFPLSPAQEDAVHDHRIAQLVEVMERLFFLCTRATCEAVCAEDEDSRSRVKDIRAALDRLALWWDRFAAHEVGDYSHVHGAEAVSSARQLATVLEAWRAQNEQDQPQGSDLTFWRNQLKHLKSPKSFSLVVDALLRRNQYRAAMGLLISWLGQAEQVPLEEGTYSFHTLALRWMLGITQPGGGWRVAGGGLEDRPARPGRRRGAS
jgi:hypothetical protein